MCACNIFSLVRLLLCTGAVELLRRLRNFDSILPYALMCVRAIGYKCCHHTSATILTRE
ncbi:hypothetical protein PF005_g8553 [Phytophthora fragariae]|uniref:Uncharacterized protein n=1 Tax=Phytophthora fragariae TaxID=53985 RepID=A0A6A3FAZ2_9STRA|nr:hypothetical protein PF003_g956 [Phytophthora fragariae]KAE8942659.1 hypothetical protein PF009_g7593 [Phytophthora fragariae]KAE9022209.1 hypothetical protein PF011_g4572 [Phytophthora fragariae]KAE9112242.1 hypothetical protein PF010_g10519 [Phytophthora fragariae]KAE9123427.1 hypothetical protein PF007_g7062 [Phytophthora fragariae]